ncbi:hypothetical protein ICG_05698 [Bacillus cereus BAG1X1-3]|nr:hypothetical protein ICG_05698 [Bacillus cereus BAG1X1-3]EOO76186.1 hypothetical protein IC7_05856 [Bacillus cereus BAG1O-1]OSX90151.1 hypothetical protein BTJ45_04224 [Bacillus mycoides]SEB13835.1 hypothetical protein SAMN04488146_11013 [Bacillus nitratireducens]
MQYYILKDGLYCYDRKVKFYSIFRCTAKLMIMKVPVGKKGEGFL